MASSPTTREAIEASDCLLTVGYRRVETTSGFFTDKLPASAIHLNSSYVDTADKNYQGVYIAELLRSIVDSSSGIVVRKQPARPSKPLAFALSNDPLTQDAYWKAMQSFLRPGDVIVVEDGASSAGMGRLTLPEDCTYITGALSVFNRLCYRRAARSHSRFAGAASHPAYRRRISPDDSARALDRHAL
jgi:indolepyruvate decarboxylase